MHHLDQILIVLGCGCVLPIMVVWLIIRESMNKTNQRTQIVLAAIEKNPDMDIECMVQIPNIRYAAQEFRDDLVVYMIGMDENRKSGGALSRRWICARRT